MDVSVKNIQISSLDDKAGLLSNRHCVVKFEARDCASREELADYYHTMQDEYEVRLGNKKVFF